MQIKFYSPGSHVTCHGALRLWRRKPVEKEVVHPFPLNQTLPDCDLYRTRLYHLQQLHFARVEP